MKRKLLILFLAIVSVFACAFAFSACGESGTDTPNQPASSIYVTGKTFIFDRVEVICDNDEMKEYFEGIKADAEESMKDDYITFKFGGNYDYVINGIVQNGTYTQSGNTVKISLHGEAFDFTATENSLSQTSVEDGVSVTIVYVKGTPSKPVTPVTPTEPTSCKHNILLEIKDYKQASCKAEGYSFDVLVCTNTVDNSGHGLRCGMIFLKGEKEPIGQLPINFRDKYYYDDLAKNTQVKNYLLKYGTTFDKLPHTPVTDPAVPATCCTKGLTEGSHCGVCNEIFKAQVVTDYSDHDYSDTITYSGAKGSDKVCTVCGKLENKEYTFKTKLNDNGQSYTLVKADGWVELDLGSEFKFNNKPVTVIGGEVFNECETLKSADLTGVESIGNSAFWDCTSFTSVILGNNLKKIGEYAFGKCAFKSLEIPKSVEYIGTAAFYLCYNLESISIPLVNGGIQGTTAGKSEYFDYLFTLEGMGGKIGHVPESLETVIITSGDKIGNQVFEYCSGLKRIAIPDSVTEIGGYAFEGCRSLTSIKIPDGVDSIDARTFCGCSGLTSVTIPDSVTSIGQDAFYGCSSLTSITIPDGMTSIEEYAFSDCSSLTSITIPNSVTTIGSWAFDGCNSLTSATIPALAINDIPRENLQTVVITSGDAIGDYAFKYFNSLTSVTILNGVTHIGEYAFEDCSGLTSITIGNSVESIGSSAFSNCSSLTNITIGNSLESIGNFAFWKCNKLTNIYYTGDIAGWCGISGLGNLMSDTRTLHINDQELTGELIIPDSTTSISAHAFEGCSSLTSVIINKGITKIGDSAFNGCSGLTSVTIPDSVTSIGEDAFYDCSSLNYEEYDNAFYLGNENNPYVALIEAKDNSITSCNINKNTKVIYGFAFSGCDRLTSITIDDSVTYIGRNTFYNCSKLTSITFKGTKTQWKAIEKGYNWNEYTGNYTVHCSDGDIAKVDDN